MVVKTAVDCFRTVLVRSPKTPAMKFGTVARAVTRTAFSGARSAVNTRVPGSKCPV